jgi:hypothetical protein
MIQPKAASSADECVDLLGRGSHRREAAKDGLCSMFI